jgi:hypothetical protein
MAPSLPPERTYSIKYVFVTSTFVSLITIFITPMMRKQQIALQPDYEMLEAT